MAIRTAALPGLVAAVLLAGCVGRGGETGEEASVEVWYATDRAPGRGGSAHGERRGDMAFGIADIRLPAIHVAGTLEGPGIGSSAIPVDPRWHVHLAGTRPVYRTDFAASVAKALAGAERRELLVYIHGYNTDFDLAVRRAGQVAHDLSHEGVTLAFSWPSTSLVSGYVADLNNADWAAPDLAETLALLIRESGAERINLLAHSMGNRVLIQALHLLADREGGFTAPPFENIVFTAPDVDRAVFIAALPEIRPLAGRLTLYAAANDMALAASRRLAGDQPRAGESGRALVLAEGLETVEATEAADDLLGHEYFGESMPVLNDMRLLLSDGLGAAERRGLERRSRQGKDYWLLR